MREQLGVQIQERGRGGAKERGEGRETKQQEDNIDKRKLVKKHHVPNLQMHHSG